MEFIACHINYPNSVNLSYLLDLLKNLKLKGKKLKIIFVSSTLFSELLPSHEQQTSKNSNSFK